MFKVTAYFSDSEIGGFSEEVGVFSSEAEAKKAADDFEDENYRCPNFQAAYVSRI